MSEPAILQGDTDALPVLVQLLESPNQIVFRQAARAVLQMKAQAQAAVPVLVRATKSPDVNIRDAAVRFLVEIDPEAAAAAGVRSRP
jgi:HEAT repeat protein